jgi:hypothetical protein
MGFDLGDVARVAGPALFGAIAGALYGYVSVQMEKPMQAGTTGWTDSGRKLVLTQRVAANGALGAALLTMADENAAPTEYLRRVMVAMEQLMALQRTADRGAALVESYGGERAREIREAEGMGTEADVAASAHRYRDVAIAIITEGMARRKIEMSEDGMPLDPTLKYAMAVILRGIHDAIFNIHVALRGWRG